MALSYQFQDLIMDLESWGLTDVLLPFLLVFTLFFAILQKTEILGKDKRNFNSVVSLVVSLLVVIPHVNQTYPTDYDPVLIINSFLPGIALVVVAVIALFILIGMWGGEAKWVGGTPSGIVVLLAFALVIGIFGSAAGWWGGWNWFNNYFGEEFVSVLIIVLIFGIVIWFITKSDKPTEGSNIMKHLGDLFKK